MASYGNKRVPVLGFHNPAASIMYPTGLHTYAMGNTRRRNVTEFLGTKEDQHLNLLLLASGDVRNILCTIAEISLRKPHTQPRSLSFHLNDYDPTVTARNAVLLEVASVIDPDVPDELDFLWNIWYNMTLSTAHFSRLRGILSSLEMRNFEKDDSALKFVNSDIHRECKDIWIDWNNLDLNVSSVKADRNQHIAHHRERSGNLRVDDQCLNVVLQMLMASNVESDMMTAGSPFYQEAKHWFLEGTTNSELEKVNPTLIRPISHKWKQHYESCPFPGYLPVEGEDLERCGTLTDACKEILRLEVMRFQSFKKKSNSALKVVLWTGDALWLCTSGLPRDLFFDIVDTSNVSDHIGLLNVLVCCAPRLKRPNESQLFTATMLWSSVCKSVKEYYDRSVGVPTQLLPTVLGLKLAIDFDLGSGDVPYRADRTEEILCWVLADRTRTVLSIDENSDVVDALLSIVERCFNPGKCVEGQLCGITLSSPLTLLRILQQIDPLIKGGVTRIYQLLEPKLPADFKTKFSLSWNLLKASTGGNKEPIVEVKVRCSVETASGFQGTPIPMVVIEEGNDIFDLWRLRAFPTSHISPESSLIYNSLRYDEETQMVTFHLREKDWTEIQSKSFLRVISNNFIPVFISCPVFVGNEGVSTVKRVDAVETFGLHSVQNFNVLCSSNNSQVVEILKVEEYKHSYSADLKVLDSPSCSAQTLGIRFQPEGRPTEAKVHFEGSKGYCIMYFSCPIEENTSRLQISRKQGKVFCQFMKSEEGTVGERVIANAATLPFHAMQLWDAGLHNLNVVCGKMFRTEADLQFKRQRGGGPPFYDLRESITLILKKQINEAKIPIVHCVEDRATIFGTYQVPQDIAQKKGLVIKVQNVYKWKHLPVAKVIFYDCEKYGKRLLGYPSNPASVEAAKEFFLLTSFHNAHRVVADHKELLLFRKMIYNNAARVEQENGRGSAWRSAFISLLFPRELAYGLDTSKRVMDERMSFPFNSRLFPDTSISESVIRSPTLQSQQASTAQVTSPKETTCNFCHKKSGNLKKCMGCKQVSYCDKECQSRDWKEHKLRCRRK